MGERVGGWYGGVGGVDWINSHGFVGGGEEGRGLN